ncbi:O-antigen ligase family protein [Hathewaya histolytica]|uniref:Exopolysaccharide biosynthesis family protein n=2 Tax=Hathewaya histolytica TaxID=1498 RepID=A0A4U9RUL8_HATHI|nr:O-antigen ligase family protein [Hathewaya histolytica]VTQ92700.1 exopolysaccharide biosynthesis family protein [Hathewaya histolytica]
MSLLESLLVYLIYTYIIVLPITPSKFMIGKRIPFNGDSIIIVIIIFYIINLIFNKESRGRFISGIQNSFKDKFSICLVVWISMMFISITYSADRKLALGESVRFSTYIILFFIIKYEIYKKSTLDRILNVITGTILIIDVVGIIEYFKGMGIVQGSGSNSFLRIVSTIENSNNLGALCVLLLFPYIMLAIKENNNIKKILYTSISFLTVFNIILSFSRNAFIGLFIGCLVFIFTYNIKLLWGLGTIVPLTLLLPKVRNRVKDIGNISQNLSRITLWEIAFLMIKDHPFLGVGAGNYRAYYKQYVSKVKYLGYSASSKFHPHNIYIKSQVELGIIGLCSLLLYLIFNLNNIIKFYNTVEEKHYKYFYKGFISSLVAFMIMNFIDNFFSAPKVIGFFWIIIAIANSYQYNIDNQKLNM